eukprot:9978887-Ditylum_brightwellii.AAC.1
MQSTSDCKYILITFTAQPIFVLMGTIIAQQKKCAAMHIQFMLKTSIAVLFFPAIYFKNCVSSALKSLSNMKADSAMQKLSVAFTFFASPPPPLHSFSLAILAAKSAILR